jgi:hypothetical protein
MRCRGIWGCCIVLVLAGCHTVPPPPGPTEERPFPPQTAMTTGDYGTFMSANLLALQQCQETADCAIALFNLGFAHAHPQSPYHDAAKALLYFNDLQEKYPHTLWAFESQLWTALMQGQLSLEREYHLMEQENLALKKENDTLEQTKFALEETQRRLQADLRARETIIRNLQERLKRSRDIDLELEKKSRELSR